MNILRYVIKMVKLMQVEFNVLSTFKMVHERSPDFDFLTDPQGKKSSTKGIWFRSGYMVDHLLKACDFTDMLNEYRIMKQSLRSTKSRNNKKIKNAENHPRNVLIARLRKMSPDTLWIEALSSNSLSNQRDFILTWSFLEGGLRLTLKGIDLKIMTMIMIKEIYS